MASPKRYASVKNPTIQAVLDEMYRFNEENDAKEQIKTLKNHFICAKKQIKNPQSPSLILWIRGFGIQPEDKAHGVIGHFAVITYKQKDGAFTLYATKQDESYLNHPQRTQVKRDNPNWGHPIIRSIRKNQTYRTIEEAQAQLDNLHKEFPKVSIPNPGKLFIMIYCADRLAKKRMVKHIIEIQTDKHGTYYLECRENTAKPKKKTKVETKPTPRAQTPVGRFTAKVALRRQKKGKTPRPQTDDPNN